ncbi:hypothetical protein CFC21_086151 [Triticum aestivum]|uniref:Uncharacterized protein n=2 Tax=Triticum aestivum TaxID=4565 RepID=A0A3B6PH12_WHEAT|nr:transcription termination factor MTERF8, chloroplastic-like [Triticum aestivum]KAF7082277.1 hypothetical protein CFC21_086151 [Triticum aestivum]
MLHLRQRIVSHIISSAATSAVSCSATSAISSLRRLLCAAAAPVSPNPSGFAVEDYLVDSCGLTRSQAIKASTKLSHLKSPANPNAVLAFLSGLGLSSSDVAAVVAKDPLFLCAGVERTLVPVVDGLTDLGLSRSEIGGLVSLVHCRFRSRAIVPKLRYYLPLFGSFENLRRLLKKDQSKLLSSDLDKVLKPNIVSLQECGLGACDIAKLCISAPMILGTNPERIRAMVACAERLGVRRGSGMFREALKAVAFLSEEKIADKVDYLKNMFKWSDTEVAIAVRKAPMLLTKSREMLRRKSEFLISEVGLEPVYIAHQPVMISYSLEGRLRPRYYVLKFLKETGLVDRHRGFYNVLTKTERNFVDKYICPHKEAAPHLAQDYATACKGEVPTNFRFLLEPKVG